jgi:hypothetical protein
MTTTPIDRIAITHAALICALDALRNESLLATKRHANAPAAFSPMMHDDHCDYANAARDQIDFCTTMLTDDEFDDALPSIQS